MVKLRRSNRSQSEVSAMDSSLVRVAFETVAGHISNLDLVRELVDEVVRDSTSLDAAIRNLENRLVSAEVTLRTDIRILINECRHLKIG
jgi:hypothetical protein